MSATLTSARVTVLAARATQRPGLRALLQLWLKRARERRELSQLTTCELRDFGASRSEAIAEIKKPFWRA